MSVESGTEQQEPSPVLNSFLNAFPELTEMKGSLQDIPDASQCMGCGGNESKEMIDYEHTWISEGLGKGFSIVIQKRLPGYECHQCGLTGMDTTFLDEFQNSVATGLARLGDTRLQETLARTKLPASEVTPTNIFPQTT